MAAIPGAQLAPQPDPPITPEHIRTLSAAVADFDRDQLLWSSGYLAGLARSAHAEVAPSPLPEAEPGGDSWTVFYATETGNSKRVAEALVRRAEHAGLAAAMQDLRDVRPKSLAKVTNALFVIATHGIGEAPDGTEIFFEYWLGDRAPRLENLNYSVLALGDSSYADFCEMGRLLDDRLRALGAKPVAARVECDLDYEDDASNWAAGVVEQAARNSRARTSAAAVRTPYLHAVAKKQTYSRDNPFFAEILLDQPITGRGSSKDVRHIELSLESSGLRYLPGDSLGILPKNPPQLVEAVLAAAKLDGSTEVTVNGAAASLSSALHEQKEITILGRPLVEKLAPRHGELREVLRDRDRMASFLGSRQIIDLLADYPKKWEAQELVDSLRRLTPRLYSIASSPDANPDEAHLTVALVNYEQFGRKHWGSASSFLTSGASEAPVYVEANDRFRLPADGDTPIVMIGAGTGVAPYRAFVEHRREHGHKGDNWLVFGERNFASDFLYQLEWLRYRKDGILTHIDVAFSRDQQRKIYVQDRLREQSGRLYDWLERGARVYVCGDADRMAGDVHRALLDVVQKQGNLSSERAGEYLNELKAARRYQRDVY